MSSDKKLVCAIRVRGQTGIRGEIKATLDMLRLYKNNFCIVKEESPTLKGMLHKCKDFITYGEIDSALYDELVQKHGKPFTGRLTDTKGKIQYNKYITIEGKNYKPFFRLNPPKKGFGRKGIKMPFTLGGALGNRGEKIADLLKRML